MVSLETLRERLGVSQEELAELLEVQQPAISKLVRRTDMKISTLRDLIAPWAASFTSPRPFRTSRWRSQFPRAGDLTDGASAPDVLRRPPVSRSTLSRERLCRERP